MASSIRTIPKTWKPQNSELMIQVPCLKFDGVLLCDCIIEKKGYFLRYLSGRTKSYDMYDENKNIYWI
jgi:hypothetical protein